MVRIGARQFHVHCTGHSAPTVILEPGLGLPSLVWAWVQADVASVSRVCIYDRAGYGWSDSTDAPRDAVNTSRELHALLEAANIGGPFVLVGHSIGGAYVRMFQAEYSQAVVGLILVDGSNPAGIDWSAVQKPSVLGTTALYYFARAGGVRALLALRIVNFRHDLPAEEGAAVKAFLSNPGYIETAGKERDSVVDTLKQIGALGNLGSLPLTVIYSEQVIHPDPRARGMDADKAAKLAERIDNGKRYWQGS
jgi:pimeloyl-ACP methyl ester carboxylesterase